MIINSCIIHLELPYVNGLKGRRAIVNSIKDKLKKLNLSILDISGEYVKEADIAICYLAPNSKEAIKYITTIESILDKNAFEYEWSIDCEEI